MHPASPRRTRLAVGLLTLAALVAACGSSTSPSPSASSAAAASPAAPGATSAAGAASPGTDSLAGISIAAPYTLVDLPAGTADTIQAGIDRDLGAYGKAVHASMKAVDENGTNAAYLMVVRLPAGTVSDNLYSQVITSLSMGAEADFPSKLVNGIPVSFGSMIGGSVAVYRKGDLVFITLATQAKDLTPIVSAVIKANG